MTPQERTFIMRKSIVTLALLLAASPLAAQDYRFTKEMRAGDRLELQNINGAIDVTQGSGRTMTVEVTKTVKRGNGDLVKAIMEEGSGYVRVCTIYLNRNPNRSTCSGDNSNSTRRGDRLEVNMHYTVRAPAGVTVDVETVNGAVMLRGIDTPASVETVNGTIDFDGVGAHHLETVNGKIRAAFSQANWNGTLDVSTVNGSVDLSLPGSLAAEIRGETVNGRIDVGDFEVTISGRWGPKSFHGTIGGGGGRVINIETVNGAITLRKR
jgi:DUF4097 and DUF4098 domain-containing protein YvlB